MTEIDEIINALIDFRNERDWEQFHNPKDLSFLKSISALIISSISVILFFRFVHCQC